MADRNERYDVLVDLHGNPSLSACREVLEDDGTLVLVGGTGGRWFMGIDRWFRSVLAAPFLRIKVRPLIHKDRLDDLATMVRMIEDGQVTPVLDRTFPLAEVADAIEYARGGKARGRWSSRWPEAVRETRDEGSRPRALRTAARRAPGR